MSGNCHNAGAKWDLTFLPGLRLQLAREIPEMRHDNGHDLLEHTANRQKEAGPSQRARRSVASRRWSVAEWLL